MRHPLTIAIGGMTAMAAGLGVSRFVYTPILPPMVAALGLSKAEAGLIASMNLAGYLVGALALTVVALPGTGRAWLVGALLVTTATLAGMAVPEAGLAVFLVLRFVAGVASAVVFVCASAIVFEHAARTRRQDMATIHFSGVGVGIAVSAACVAALAGLGAGWAELWLASAALSLLAAGIVALALPAEPMARPAPPSHMAGTNGAGFTAFVLAYGLFGFGYVITATFLVAIARASPAAAPFEPYSWILLGLGAIPSVALWTGLGQRFGRLPVFALASLIEAVGVAVSVLWPTIGGLVIGALFLGGTFMGLTALGTAAARAMPGGDPSRRIALVTAAFGTGQIIGPSFAGYAYDRTGDFVLSSLVAAAALCLAAGLALIGPRTAPVTLRRTM